MPRHPPLTPHSAHTPDWLKDASDKTKAWFTSFKELSFPEESEASTTSSAGTDHSHPIESFDPNLMNLTKRLIEVRTLLRGVQGGVAAGPGDPRHGLTLPSIVVIGAQSSGKSSVLESIVGHEFLPKGTNMVTRRPIELTLIHSPDVVVDYGVFPHLGLGPMRDFAVIQRTLADLNLAVPEELCVSRDPIELEIYSPNVPDLSLVDLPGYIQLHSLHQPPSLKADITALCDAYTQEPNILLAVSAADVDLANSEALRAARKVDPTGKRTLGVITKMDLVSPEAGVRLLTNTDYPLQLGYVGLICRGAVAGNHPAGGGRGTFEGHFFSTHAAYHGQAVGTRTLCWRLMQVLEAEMRSSLGSVMATTQAELRDARYAFKVQCNDRPLTADSYIAELLDDLKLKLKAFSDGFKKPHIRSVLQDVLMAEVFKICDATFWREAAEATEPEGMSHLSLALAKSCTPGPARMADLQAACAQLTRVGVGRLT